MIQKFVFGMAICVALIPSVILAAPVIRSGENVSVGSDQVVNGDFYGFGDTANLSGAINGDAYIIGRKITINAPIAADAVLTGSAVQVHAPIGDDFRAFGGEVILADDVAGDVFVIGGELHILSTASIEGDVIFYGGRLIVEGSVDGSVFSTGNDTRIDAFVGGDLHVNAEHMTLGDRTEVLGDIIYRGGTNIVRSQNAVVVGDIQEDMQEAESVSFGAVFIPFIIGLFSVLIAFLLFRPFFQSMVHETKTQYGKQGLIGLAVFVAAPFAAFILMVSVLGLFVGIFLLALYVALVVAAWITATIAVGTYLMGMVTKRYEVTLTSVVVGVVALDVALLIPLIGPMIAFATLLIALGALSLKLYQHVFGQ